MSSHDNILSCEVIVTQSAKMRRLSVAVALCLLAAACRESRSGVSDLVSCNGVTSITVTPSATHLSIGDTLTAKATYNGPACSPAADPASYRWTSQNVSVAQVDSLAGRIRAMGIGNTLIIVRASSGAVGTLSLVVP